MIIMELTVSHRAALDLVAELGVREVRGRGSFRAWGDKIKELIRGPCSGVCQTIRKLACPQRRAFPF